MSTYQAITMAVLIFPAAWITCLVIEKTVERKWTLLESVAAAVTTFIITILAVVELVSRLP